MNTIQNPVHVLLADDDEDDRSLFEHAVNALSVSVILKTVSDGEKLLGILSHIETSPPPDVIFLDLNMPRINGLTCLEEIRRNKKFDRVPVFMFSTSEREEDIEATYGKGANLYIPKDLFFFADKQILEKLFSLQWTKYLDKIPIEKFVLRKNMIGRTES